MRHFRLFCFFGGLRYTSEIDAHELTDCIFTTQKVIIKHRASDEAQMLVESILGPLQSRFVYLSYEDHDVVTANTQAVTHAAFLRWVYVRCASFYPWLLRSSA